MSIGRRSFLATIGAGIGMAAEFLYPGTGEAAERLIKRPLELTSTQTRDTDLQAVAAQRAFAQGAVVSRTGDRFELNADGTSRIVTITPEMVVWREISVSPDAIEIGDWLDVGRGTPMNDGSLLARSEWVFANIGRRDGEIAEIGPDGIDLVTTGQKLPKMELSTHLEIINAEDGSTVPSGLESFGVGDKVGAVGLLLKDGGFRATRMWKHPKTMGRSS